MVTVKGMDFKSNNRDTTLVRVGMDNEPEEDLDEKRVEEPVSSNRRKVAHLKLQRTVSFEDFFSEMGLEDNDINFRKQNPEIPLFRGSELLSSATETASKLDVAAIRLQKVYKSYRTRRSLADCAVVIEELWWKARDFVALRRSSISFFDSDKSETAVSKWARARTRAAKVGKGLSKDEKAQKLALRHWLEAIDPRHRYGQNLHFYYNVWFNTQSSQPFFYWLDIGDGKEVNLEKCPRTQLQRQCIKYLGPKEREAYAVNVEGGKLVYRQSGELVDTADNSKWIFVLSTSRNLYVGQKKKGQFQHSSFLHGGATIASGRLVAQKGVLNAIWPYSGHYRPKEENFMEFISFLEENHVDLTNVKKYPVDDDVPTRKGQGRDEELMKRTPSFEEANSVTLKTRDTNEENMGAGGANEEALMTKEVELGKPLSRKWTTGAGPRIGCGRDYPAELQCQALEQVNLTPRAKPANFGADAPPIPSPRPSPKMHLSPRLAYMRLPSPKNTTC